MNIRDTFTKKAAIAVVTGSALMYAGFFEIDQGFRKQSNNAALASICVDKVKTGRDCTALQVRAVVEDAEGQSQASWGVIALTLGAVVYVPAYRRIKGPTP